MKLIYILLHLFAWKLSFNAWIIEIKSLLLSVSGFPCVLISHQGGSLLELIASSTAGLLLLSGDNIISDITNESAVAMRAVV